MLSMQTKARTKQDMWRLNRTRRLGGRHWLAWQGRRQNALEGQSDHGSQTIISQRSLSMRCRMGWKATHHSGSSRPTRLQGLSVGRQRRRRRHDGWRMKEKEVRKRPGWWWPKHSNQPKNQTNPATEQVDKSNDDPQPSSEDERWINHPRMEGSAHQIPPTQPKRHEEQNGGYKGRMSPWATQWHQKEESNRHQSEDGSKA